MSLMLIMCFFIIYDNVWLDNACATYFKQIMVMNIVELLIFMASLCLPIWMGEVMDYVHNLDDLFEVLAHVEEIMSCLASSFC